MNTQAFITDLEGVGVRLKTQNNRLFIEVPVGVITGNIRGQLKQEKQKIINALCSRKPVIAFTNQQQIKPAATLSKMKVYRITARGKSMAVLDPSGTPETEMKRQLLAKFGSALESVN